MIEEYENWEDSIRRTFIELTDYMNKTSDPIEFAIEFAWANGCDIFTINNAKDQLKKLKELGDLQKSINGPVAYAQVNDNGDLYDLRLQNNPYNDQDKIVPLYRIDHE